MKKSRLYLSTIADDAAALAQAYGLQLELAEFCTASNMDDNYEQTAPRVQAELAAARRFILHAPFNELYPATIDPKAVELVHYRLNQASQLALSYGIRKIVVHSGYVPRIYYKCWFRERAVLFWREFLRSQPPSMRYCLENVLEDEPELLLRVVEEVDDSRLGLCLDVGHANCISPLSPLEWLRIDGPRLLHFHLHNNDGQQDDHQCLDQGSLDMQAFLTLAEELCPEATYTIENLHAAPSVLWLLEKGFIANSP